MHWEYDFSAKTTAWHLIEQWWDSLPILLVDPSPVVNIRMMRRTVEQMRSSFDVNGFEIRYNGVFDLEQKELILLSVRQESVVVRSD